MEEKKEKQYMYFVVLPKDYDKECMDLVFSDKEYIANFFVLGDKIALVTVPETEEIVPVQFGFKASHVEISDIRELWTIETFEWLMQLQVDLHIWNDWILALAAKNGKQPIVEFLVKNGFDIHAESDYAFQCAAGAGQVEMMKWLYEHGADIHADDDMCLTVAASKGHLEAVKYLVSLGIDPHGNDDEALESAKVQKHTKVVKYLENL